MRVWDIIPFDIDKNLGRAYNETMRLIPSEDWACIRDSDTCWLTPDGPLLVHRYAQKFPDAALMTCKINRASTLSKQQLYNGVLSEIADIKHHIRIAEQHKQYLYETEHIEKDISGTLMLISKKAWERNPFPENGQCLAVDTTYIRMLKSKGETCLLMKGVYLFHIYRMKNGIYNKQHLQ